MVELKLTREDAGKVFKTTEDYIVYKKLNVSNGNSYDKGIAVMVIPKGSTIVVPLNFKVNESRGTRKLRCSKAFCLYIIPAKSYYGRVKYLDLNTKFKYNSIYKTSFKYVENKMIRANLSKDTSTACKEGIHFFTDIKDVERYG